MAEYEPPSAHFHKFRSLPAEVRLRIWEMSWPKRIIEVVEADDIDSEVKNGEEGDGGTGEEDDDEDNGDDGDEEDGDDSSEDTDSTGEPSEMLILRPAASLSAWLKIDFAQRETSSAPLIGYGDPVALQVCRESRAHALGRYIRLQHLTLKDPGFYFNPQRDSVWLYDEFSSDSWQALPRMYSESLGRIRTVMCEALEFWDVDNIVSILSEAFAGIQSIAVVLESYQFANDPSERADKAEYTDAAEKLRVRDGEALQGRDWDVEYIDREGNIY